MGVGGRGLAGKQGRLLLPSPLLVHTKLSLQQPLLFNPRPAPSRPACPQALHSRVAEIRVQFRHVPGNLYRNKLGLDLDRATNELVGAVQRGRQWDASRGWGWRGVRGGWLSWAVAGNARVVDRMAGD